VELLQRISSGLPWDDVKGLAYREGEQIVATALRPSVADLDTLPWPDRGDIDYEAQHLPTASVLGSRGCPWDCSFCSIRPFYEAQEGPLRRLRRPAAIVEEMRALHGERGVSVFLFQDDDFLAGGARARTWACDIAQGLIDAGLSGKAVFKMSCRSDEIRTDCLQRLVDGGLTHVYMGVENGDPQGLINMSKRITPDQHLQAGRVLRELGLSFDFGFMLLDPFSTLSMVRNNIDFLDAFVGDGWAVASFCRMLPYAGTPLKTRLEQSGRLLGTPFEPDYRFLDPKLDLFYDWMLETFHTRNFTNHGLCHILKSLLFESRLRLPGDGRFSAIEQRYVQHLSAVSNGLATYALRAALDHIETTPLATLERDRSFLTALTRHEQREEQRLLERVVDFYWSVRQRRGDSTAAPTAGAFESSWTLASGDTEALVDRAQQ
jgi:hypothetical protein